MLTVGSCVVTKMFVVFCGVLWCFLLFVLIVLLVFLELLLVLLDLLDLLVLIGLFWTLFEFFLNCFELF